MRCLWIGRTQRGYLTYIIQIVLRPRRSGTRPALVLLGWINRRGQAAATCNLRGVFRVTQRLRQGKFKISVESSRSLHQAAGVIGRWFVLQFQKLPPRTRAIVQTSLYGLAAGVAAVAFQMAINWLYGSTLVKLSHSSIKVF